MRLFSNVWSENTALFERLMEIHSNSPKLYYGFKSYFPVIFFFLEVALYIMTLEFHVKCKVTLEGWYLWVDFASNIIRIQCHNYN